MWVLVGLLAGIIAGLLIPYQIPVALSEYVAVGFLAGLDSVLGGLRAGFEDRFDNTVFTSGFFTNMALAVLVAWVGKVLGADLYLAAAVTFGIRIFTNLGPIRRHLLGKPPSTTATGL